MTKYTNVEEAEVLSSDEHDDIESGLHSVQKTSAAKLTIDERKIIIEPVLHRDNTGT